MKSLIQKVLLTLLLLNAVGYAAQVKTAVIYFGKDKAYITAGEAQKLADLKSADYVLLKGHTDNDGSDGYNVGLSKKRVDAIKAYILNIDKGIKVETDYFGEKQPINNNANEDEKTLNRRVEITYVSDPLLRINVPGQIFEIDNSKEQVIACKHGTQIHVPAGAFNNKRVSISVSEYYQPDEIFAANLSTHCNNAPIETSGMINITAESDGVPVVPSKPLEYKFPRKNKNTDFKFFAGVRDSFLNMNWVLNKPAEPAVAENSDDVSRVYGNSFTSDVIGIADTVNSFYKASYTANLGDNAVAKFFEQLLVVDRTLYNGCLQNASVDISINSGGRITSVKDNYANKMSDCDLSVQRFIWACLPTKFSPYTKDTYIHIEFNAKGEDSTYIKSVNAANATLNAAINARYEADNIVLNSTNLGWINCDRFLSGIKLAKYTVETEAGASVRLVLKKYRSFFGSESSMPITGQGNAIKATRFFFHSIPANEDVVLISTMKVDDTIYLAIEKTKTSLVAFTKFNYKAVTQAELAEAMKHLDI